MSKFVVALVFALVPPLLAVLAGCAGRSDPFCTVGLAGGSGPTPLLVLHPCVPPVPPPPPNRPCD